MTAANSIQQGQDFFRVRRQINSDLPYVAGFDCGTSSAAEFDVGVKSIAVGPDSSFDRYRVFYYDPANDFQVELGYISTKSPWFARIDCFPEQVINPLNQKGKIYVVPQNNFNASLYTVGAGVTVVVNPPILDVIGYTSERMPAPTVRPSVLYDMALENTGNPNASLFYFPFYGRHSADVMIYGSRGALANLNVAFQGQRMGYFEQSTSESIVASTPHAAEMFFHYEATGLAASQGHYEYLILLLIPSGGFTGNDPAAYDDGGLRAWVEIFDK